MRDESNETRAVFRDRETRVAKAPNVVPQQRAGRRILTCPSCRSVRTSMTTGRRSGASFGAGYPRFGDGGSGLSSVRYLSSLGTTLRGRISRQDAATVAWLARRADAFRARWRRRRRRQGARRPGRGRQAYCVRAVLAACQYWVRARSGGKPAACSSRGRGGICPVGLVEAAERGQDVSDAAVGCPLDRGADAHRRGAGPPTAGSAAAARQRSRRRRPDGRPPGDTAP